VLQLLSWSFVRFIFDAMSQGLETSNTNEHFAINMLLGKWASFSLLIFMIAPYFITFSFKFSYKIISVIIISYYSPIQRCK